ncbi:MAG TPA: hypothetical protein VM580_11940 [Labilithrix sp.]|nr:hypothetical protein [Labilithrix sp.]
MSARKTQRGRGHKMLVEGRSLTPDEHLHERDRCPPAKHDGDQELRAARMLERDEDERRQGRDDREHCPSAERRDDCRSVSEARVCVESPVQRLVWRPAVPAKEQHRQPKHA